ncbi:ninjurin-1-like [Gigantopelta aegis]|uniref:ninjurin-1-like n=1 Tax=Gigantopelta aegis TaxID=1735272 RepID=UPI001B888A6B|nr:ninjurin-1-like [Gigantopelta aegis]
MLDIALLMANASQLKAVLDAPAASQDNYFVPSLVFLSVSITLQVGVSVILLVLGTLELRTRQARNKADVLNNVSVGLILAIIILNVFIASFGIRFSGST